MRGEVWSLESEVRSPKSETGKTSLSPLVGVDVPSGSLTEDPEVPGSTLKYFDILLIIPVLQGPLPGDPAGT